jgi:hypothetical protein
MSARLDLTGMVFGKLTALDFVPNRNSSWRCNCTCGNTVVTLTDSLRSGKSKSCGCGIAESASRRFTTHGETKNRKRSEEYVAWVKMHERCSSFSKNKNVYFDRGIQICDRWKVYENFLEDMGRKPPSTSLDRKNNNKGYYKDNCRWATQKQQCRNLRKNVLITFNGETKCMAEWAESLGMPYGRLQARLRYYGWSVEEALTTPKLRTKINFK